MNEQVTLFPYEASVVTKFEKIPEGVTLVQAPKFWEKGAKGEGVKIAVIDTGCDINHVDLNDRIIDKRNFTTEDGSAQDMVTDYVGHGTHVAGIIAANENGDGVVGVAPRAQLLILKALTRKGGEHEWVIKAIDHAVDKQADIISMSLGGKTDNQGIHDAIIRATERGILVVCSSGNDGDGSEATSEVNYPASYKETISVGSISIDKQISRFSASNSLVDLVAPGQGLNGVGIVSTAPGSQYVAMSGTSMAAPHVTGALALIINWTRSEFKRNLEVHELYAQLIKKTVPLGYPKSLEGNGMLYLTADELLKSIINRQDIINSVVQP